MLWAPTNASESPHQASERGDRYEVALQLAEQNFDYKLTLTGDQAFRQEMVRMAIEKEDAG